MSNNYLIAINKPKNWTSSDVVIKVRNILSKALGEKVKVGHMGTLDPIATGVLLLGVNKATRLFDYFLLKDKTYIGTLTFGTSYDTLDSTGKIVETSSLPEIFHVHSILPQFEGEIYQVPPKYSAIKIDGNKAYDLARAGKDVDIQPRKVNINNITMKSYLVDKGKVTDVELKVECSSGTYIRSLFYDIAKSIGVAGHMSSLNRVKLANIDISNTITIEQLIDNPLGYFIEPATVLSSLMPQHELTAEEFSQLKTGNSIKIDNNSKFVAMIYDNKAQFVAENINGVYKSRTNLE